MAAERDNNVGTKVTTNYLENISGYLGRGKGIKVIEQHVLFQFMNQSFVAIHNLSLFGSVILLMKASPAQLRGKIRYPAFPILSQALLPLQHSNWWHRNIPPPHQHVHSYMPLHTLVGISTFITFGIYWIIFIELAIYCLFKDTTQC